MARKAREKSSTGFYAVLLRSADKERSLFLDDNDYENFIARLDRRLGDFAAAFALIKNAACMIIKESETGIGSDIKPITTGYARYYAAKYGCPGGVFERRFKSIPIESGSDMAAQLACVHGLCRAVGMEGYTGRYIDDELYIPQAAAELMGGTEEYRAAIGTVTDFFACVTDKKPIIKRKPSVPEEEPEVTVSVKPAEPKKKKTMPSWLL